MKVSASLENYLEEIYDLSHNDGKVRVTDLAKRIGVSKPSVNKAITNLKEQGFILHEKYGTFELTEKGILVAKDIASRHILLKAFLKDVLGVDDSIADEEACLMEHCLSKDTMMKLENFLVNEDIISKKR
ncbi:MAG: metal-dependent transcriptional regulator [Lachnospirales bacterium]